MSLAIAGPMPPDPAAAGLAWGRGAECLARDFDGRSFRDPYLAYVYPEEDLPGPRGLPRLTYRKIDADIVLALIGRQGGVPPALAPAVAQARESLDFAAGRFLERGLGGLRRGGRRGGIALDTYCAVGWLLRDEAMAREVAGALDGDGWLAEALYSPGEKFRLAADECWCLRLLASTGIDPSLWRPALDRVSGRFRAHAAAAAADRGTFYEAWHLGMVLSEIDPSHPRLGEVIGAMEDWAAAHLAEGSPRPGDLFEWVNLASAEALRSPEGAALRDRAAAITISGQGEDGCWSMPGERDGTGRSFLTLRAMLAIAPYRFAARSAPEGPASPAP